MRAVMEDGMTAVAPTIDNSQVTGLELVFLTLNQLEESPHNPRQRFDLAQLEELAASLRRKQLTPIVVRPKTGPSARAAERYEIGAGHRRYRAAKLGNLPGLLAIVQSMSDVEFYELLVFENGQRTDLTALEEARGYRTLMERAGYTIQKIAEHEGRSTRYVYDSISLLKLNPDIKKLLEDGIIQRAHAIELARLTESEQRKVVGSPAGIHGRYGHASGLFEYEEADSVDQQSLPLKQGVKVRSVPELKSYINDRIRFRPEKNDLQELFPNVASAIEQSAKPGELPPVFITYDHSLSLEAKDPKQRTYTKVSWKRADGQEKSKVCDWNRWGIVAAGIRRGDAFKVCVNRDKCAVHFPQSAKRKKAKASGSSASSSGLYDVQTNLRRQQQEARERAERERWLKAVPAMRQAVAEKIKTLPTNATGQLAQVVVKECMPNYGGVGGSGDVFPVGKTADDVLRRAAYIAIARKLGRDAYWLMDDAPKALARIGLNARQIVDKAVPKPKAEQKPATKKIKKGSR